MGLFQRSDKAAEIRSLEAELASVETQHRAEQERLMNALRAVLSLRKDLEDRLTDIRVVMDNAGISVDPTQDLAVTLKNHLEGCLPKSVRDSLIPFAAAFEYHTYAGEEVYVAGLDKQTLEDLQEALNVR
jgi:hypothetical protein